MDRATKQNAVETLHDGLTDATIVVVARHNGLTVAESTDLRRKMRDAGARFRVTKNTLAKLAIKDTPFANLESLFKGPTAVAFSADAVAVAKATTQYAKGNDKFEILGGSMGGDQLIDAKGIEALTKLPPIEELRAKILGLLNTPAGQLVGVLNQPATLLVGVLQAPGAQLGRVIQAYVQKTEDA